ncbi:acetyl-CoA carboxylase biotin carboxyl carrier protein subunit [Halalkalibacter akibai]|uniref:Biotin carboxyl carrier protein of methylcrotonyl-CoA carboxylase n=1 Tax=Halalkalibacter akibai (strain ATCC 43226 / DSM 21942 / CIP 109018 / JCM 9157 / 1139) TaxID=1236973 RepID=W4QWE4_HALA3|nr:acetyl-CoA carboxylase biotin carboxyl carrier protein subunit [Halalkalibacter akibai]GAE35649.1 biotin carboxyl carrier protein of methylcrotonyl-CoA carboxylase [Halalkalibacter akibai JCM 9157]
MNVIKTTMAGNIWKILVAVGDQVIAGQEVAILESMKMEIPVESLQSGKVKAIKKAEGEFIDEDEVLIELEIS